MNVIINSNKLDSLAMGVYRVTGEEPPLTLDEMTEALQNAEIGGSATLITKNITNNGTYNASADNADGYSSVTVNVSGGGGTSKPNIEDPVKFWDYDGTLLYSYTDAQALALTELPTNPSHTGLVAEGWNWTLEEIKSYATDYPDGDINVG